MMINYDLNQASLSCVLSTSSFLCRLTTRCHGISERNNAVKNVHNLRLLHLLSVSSWDLIISALNRANCWPECGIAGQLLTRRTSSTLSTLSGHYRHACEPRRELKMRPRYEQFSHLMDSSKSREHIKISKFWTVRILQKKNMRNIKHFSVSLGLVPSVRFLIDSFTFVTATITHLWSNWFAQNLYMCRVYGEISWSCFVLCEFAIIHSQFFKICCNIKHEIFAQFGVHWDACREQFEIQSWSRLCVTFLFTAQNYNIIALFWMINFSSLFVFIQFELDAFSSSKEGSIKQSINKHNKTFKFNENMKTNESDFHWRLAVRRLELQKKNIVIKSPFDTLLHSVPEYLKSSSSPLVPSIASEWFRWFDFFCLFFCTQSNRPHMETFLAFFRYLSIRLSSHKKFSVCAIWNYSVQIAVSFRGWLHVEVQIYDFLCSTLKCLYVWRSIAQQSEMAFGESEKSSSSSTPPHDTWAHAI